MSANYREQLSALMDGELSRDETRFLLRRLDADQDLATSWSNYQLVSQVLQKRFATPLRANFAASVMSSITTNSIAVEKSNVSRGGLLRWAGGGAIAAAVAVFALTATRPLNDTQPAQSGVAANGVSSVPRVEAQRVESQLASATLPNFPAIDLTQPASYDSLNPYSSGVVYIPRYTRYRNEAAERFNDFGPYVLSTSSQKPVQAEPQVAPTPQP
jgi:sigma-E factor negative regulatory protein RseA